MDYETRQQETAPAPVQKPLRPWMGFAVFIIVILSMIFIAAPLQYYLGMPGLALTELMFLLIALAAALITRRDLRKVFPFQRPRLRLFFGTLLLWIGTYLLVLLISLVLMYFFPQGFADVTSNITDFFSTLPFPLMFLIVAVSPAICEEALHRGFIQHCFYGFRKPWAIVLLSGVLFGIFHLDPYRFLPTALLGMALAYLMLKTENLLYPALFHFINNALSSFSSTSTGEMEASADYLAGSAGLLSIGSYLFLAAGAPFLVWAASLLLRKKSQPKGRLLLPVLILSTLTFLMLAAGVFLILYVMIAYPETLENLQLPK